MTIPPTRSLVQQRDYRARRALYVTELEERCRKTEEENFQLRKELAEARERLVNPAVLLPETAAASSELLQQLSSAKDALIKFNQLLNPQTSNRTNHPDLSLGAPHSHNDMNPRVRKELHLDDSESYRPSASAASSPTTTMFEGPSSNGTEYCSEECCGGIMDCRELCEDECNGSSSILSRSSQMRSTTS